MNEYQSPYLEGEVVASEERDTSARGFEQAQPLPVAAEKKINGCSKSASDCLHKTKQLAQEFNHGTFCAAHLVLAMTLIPNATRQFELRKVDIDKAFRAAMSVLMDMERGSPDHRSAPRPSEEQNVIVTLAQEIARNRDNQEVSVDDLLTAVDRMPQETSAAKLLRGEHGAADQQVRSALDQLAGSVDHQIQSVNQQIQGLNQQMHDLGQQVQDLNRTVQMPPMDSVLGREIAEVKSYLQLREGNLERFVAAELAEIKNRLSTPQESPNPPQPPMREPERQAAPRSGGFSVVAATGACRS